MPAPLAVPVGGALDVRGTGLDCGDGVGDGAPGVVLTVDAHPEPTALPYLGHHLVDAHRQHASVGVAEHDHVGAGPDGGFRDPQPVVAVGGVPVEEMLAVDEHPPPVRDEVPDRVRHHREVLLLGGPQRPLDVAHVGLGDQRDHRRAGVEQRLNLGVGRSRRPGPTGGPEGDQLGGPQVELPRLGPREELGVLGHRARPAALDEADPELVQQVRNGHLVGDRVGDAFPLGTVTQRGVEDVKSVAQRGWNREVSSGRPG